MYIYVNIRIYIYIHMYVLYIYIYVYIHVFMYALFKGRQVQGTWAAMMADLTEVYIYI